MICALTVPWLHADCPPAPGDPAAARAAYQERRARAAKLFASGEYVQAAEELRSALCLAPRDAHAYHALGLAEAAAGRPERAEEALAQARRLAPADFAIALGRAQVELSLDKFQVARGALLEAARLEPADPHEASVHAQMGRQLFGSQQYDLALAELLRYRQRAGSDPDILLLLARLENTLGAYADAVRDGSGMENRQELTPGVRAAAAAIAGLAEKNLDRADQAMVHLNLAISLGEANPGAVFETACLALAEIQEGKRDPAAARAALERGRKALPELGRIVVALGRNLAEAGDPGTVALLEPWIAKHPDQADAYKWLAQGYASRGETRRATQALEQLAALRGDYPMIDVMIAQSMLKEAEPDYVRALERLARAERVSLSDPDVYYLRGRALTALGRYPEAAEALRRAVELAPNAANSYYQLGLVYQKLGRTALAQQQFERTRELREAAAAVR